MGNYEAVIGLEVHVQVRTESKMFCACPNRYGAEPNSLVCPVCLGYPGVLPTPNKAAIRKTIAAGLACDCEIARFSKFDRKSYFYPDMPKNYQISQFDLPFAEKGRLRISGKGFSGEDLPEKIIGITRIHLEEDVGKSTHFSGFSGLDYNRAGVPLMEIVSEPDMNSADEAYAYLTGLKQIMRYIDIGDCDMEKGQMRCDVNISLRPRGDVELGTKIEIKNLNSFRSAHRGILSEIKRQSKILDQGGSLEQETRSWDDDSGRTSLLRGKESAHDYRYFPDPDLMPITFSERDIDEIKAQVPELPEAKRHRFIETYELTSYDAEVLTSDKDLAAYFEIGVESVTTPKLLANWIISELLRELADSGSSISECPVKPISLAKLVEMINSKVISGKIAKTVFVEMWSSGKGPEEIVEEKSLVQVTDTGAIEGFVEEAIASNPTQVDQYKSGKGQVIQFFVGQVMKLSRGKANPQMAVELLKKKLDA